ncbi:hypothetical protein POM88_052948 [Heracleum sosnowskyi]|uniref:WPP domain-associated protein n=1 Tax=Heracleum sosnowskyi TaxID=360622 RepID=A0AAD8GRZ1_9APIA|nr:hypothetical protein POM88_052948 [Heracleum sosnowskyi]
MDEYSDEMNCRYRSDSIVMRLLRSAMDNAYERAESTDGSIECLHERSIFYELAIIQIKGCYGLIHEDTGSCIPERSRENMLADLIELKDLLQARLKETESLIHENDYELIKRSKNEFKLRHALALKERELQHLRANIEIERAKSESFQDLIINFQPNNRYEATEGEICELKNSIDKQVLNIKQNLEDERARKSALSAMDLEIDADMLYEYENCYISENKELYARPEQNIVIEQMSSDIDILEGTLKIAFERMQNAEIRLLEEQVKWMIERETTSSVIKGYILDLKQKVEVSSRFSNEYMLELIDEMTRLRAELVTLIIRNETIERRDQGNYKSLYAPVTSSEPLPDSDYMEELAEEDLAAENTNHVAKMIQNHEYFIRSQQRKLLGCNKVLGRRRYLSAERDKSRSTERRIRDAVEKLDNVIKLKDKKWIKIPACLEHEKRKKGTSRSYKKLLKEERIRFKEEKFALELQALVVEDTHIILSKGLLEKFYLELCTCESENFIRDEIYFTFYREAIKRFTNTYYVALEEHRHFCLQNKLKTDICTIFTREMINEFKERVESNVTEILGNEKHRIVYDEVIKSIRNEAFFATRQHQDLRDVVESSLKVDVDTMMLRDIVKALKMEKEAYEFQNFVREVIYWLVIVPSMKEALNQCRSENLVYKNYLGSSLKSAEQTFSLLKCPELKKYLMPKTNADTKEENLQPGELDQCGTIDSSSGYLTSFNLASKKFESSMHQLSTSKELLKVSRCTLGIQIDNVESLHEKKKSLAKSETIQSVLCSSSDIMFSPLIRSQKLLLDFKDMAEQKLQTNNLRLEKLKQKTDLMFQASSSVRKNNLLYKEASVRRCYNLQLGENEVDLLGDQVDALLGLLHKIYIILDQYSPILSLYFDVSGILKQIDEKVDGMPVHAANL